MNDKERNNLIKKAIAFSLTAAACIIALCCWLFIGHGSFAWFAKNKLTSANGLSIQSNADDIRFENVITITPSVGGSVYESVHYVLYSDGCYYQVQKSAAGDGLESAGAINGIDYSFSTDKDGNKIPVSLTGLFPGETLTVTVKFRCYGTKRLGCSLSLRNFDDSNGKFVVPAGDGNTDGEYSVMGIFRAGLTPESGTADFTAGEHNGKYLATFDTANKTSVTTADPFVIASGTVSPDNGVVTCSFYVTIDLGSAETGNETGYYSLKGTTTNMLSKKRLRIGMLALDVTD